MNTPSRCRCSRPLRRVILPLAFLAAVNGISVPLLRAQEGVRITPPYTSPVPRTAFTARALALRDSLVAFARAQLGRRYRHGGDSPGRGFDCSGLVAYVLASFHLNVPRTAARQAETGATVAADTAQLAPGDLVTFGHGARVTHIGIYVGGGRFVQASSRAGRVIETPLIRSPAPGIKPWRGARRVVVPDSDSAPAAQAAPTT
jgi:cell wall-associated NlpC family hydrolase